MTERERALTAIRGETPDRIPWIPRLEFWYRAALRKGTLPKEWTGLTLEEIVRRLGCGLYALNPDYTSDVTNTVDRGLGLWHIPALPYDFELEGVERRLSKRQSKNGTENVVEYVTPVGTVQTAYLFTEEMLDAGASIPWVSEVPIRKPEHFEAVGYIFEHIKVKPNPAGYQALRDKVGEQGVAVAFLLGTAGPMHHIMKELMFTEEFYFAMADYPEKIYRLAEQMRLSTRRFSRWRSIPRRKLSSWAATTTIRSRPPPVFRQHILPDLKQYAERLHQRGKYLLTHTDGENRRLIPLYLEAGFDIADSVCPYPMTRLTLEETLAAFAGRITIWGGIPSTQLCPSSTSREEFRGYADRVDRALRPRQPAGARRERHGYGRCRTGSHQVPLRQDRRNLLMSEASQRVEQGKLEENGNGGTEKTL